MKFFASMLIFCFSLTSLYSSVKPKKLEKGDLIALVYPAWVPNDAIVIDQISLYLQKQGYRTVFYPEKTSPIGNFSDTDENRANSLMQAWKDSDVKAIWCVRGGWGASKILDYLDYEFIQNNPKIFIGMSDITSLHQALNQKADLVTFLGPVLTFFTNDDFEKERSFLDFESLVAYQNLEELPFLEETFVINEGVSEGKLVGGNLTLIASQCGSNWQLDTKDKILVIEDVGERPYKVDRNLWQLKEAGLLDNLAGVVIGEFVSCKQREGSNDRTLLEVFEEYFSNASYPVIYGLATGHGDYQTTLPLNTHVRIDTYNQLLSIIEKVVN